MSCLIWWNLFWLLWSCFHCLTTGNFRCRYLGVRKLMKQYFDISFFTFLNIDQLKWTTNLMTMMMMILTMMWILSPCYVLLMKEKNFIYQNRYWWYFSFCGECYFRCIKPRATIPDWWRSAWSISFQLWKFYCCWK